MRKNMQEKNFYRIELLLVILAVILFLLFGKWKIGFHEDKWTKDYVSTKEVVLELQFSVYSKEEWEEFFCSYKETYITNEMVTAVLKKLGAANVISWKEGGKQRAVAREEWNQVYHQMLDYLDIEHKIEKKEILILEIENQEESTVLITNLGTIFTKLPAAYFTEWKNYQAYFIGTDCVGIEKISDAESVISNVYLISGSDGKIEFLYAGKHYAQKANLGGQVIETGVADLTVKNGKLIAIGQKQDYIVGNLLSYDETTIEIEGYGKIAHPKRVPVYQVYDEVTERSVTDIVLGNMEVKYIIGPNEVCAIIITAPAEVANVRVLLLAEDGGKFRENVYLSCDGAFNVVCGAMTETHPAGTVICAGTYIHAKEEMLMLTPHQESNSLYFCDSTGNRLSNLYSGHMEVRKYEKGLCVVNEVPFETYLYSVVPSEMPSNYEPEALKAQAVCARSYAYMQVMRSDLAAYGAHINDSTSYQVYNNVAKTEASIQAVNETAGKVMLYGGNVIEAYYFSTSMGYTDTVEIWNVSDEETYGYLKKACLNWQEYTGDLSQEEDFKAYLQTDISGCDSDIKFYRWQIKADYAKQTDTIKEILKSRRSAVKKNIIYYEKDGVTETDSMEGFGSLVSLNVAKRSVSGSILTLMVQFENGSAAVKSEYNIRKVLGSGAEQITYKDGSTSENVTLLPSAFCTVERLGDGTYLLCGGGYGHGLGMSQNGANGLAKNGYTYEDILNYFYKDIELVDIRNGY